MRRGRMSAERNSRAVLNDPPPPPAGERLVYGAEPLQFGDSRVPAATAPHPLVILIARRRVEVDVQPDPRWAHGDRADGRGLRTFNIEYRRVGDPGGGWPGTYEDVLAGRRLCLAASEGIDPRARRDRGPLGRRPACTARRGRAAGLPVIADGGRTPTSWPGRATRARVSSGIDSAPGRRIAAQPDPARRPPDLHPRHQGRSGPVWVSTAFVDAASAAGDDATLVTLEGAGHFDMIDPQSSHWPRLVSSVAAILS